MRFHLCLVLAGRAELEAPHDPAGAREALAEAESLSSALALARDSTVGLRIARTREALGRGGV
jgi:hypothetical protein